MRKITPKACAALFRIADGDGWAWQHTRQMINSLSGNGLIDFDPDSFKYVLSDRGREEVAWRRRVARHGVDWIGK